MHEWPRRHRITVERLYRMADAGLFEGSGRVELVDGEIIDVPPMGSRHAGTLHEIGQSLTTVLAGRAIVRQQLPLRLDDESEPLPDIAVVRLRGDRYLSSHPTAADTLLVVEISETTLRYDRDVKVALYSRAGVPEVWVVDLQANRVYVHRSPAAGAYAATEVVEFGPLRVAEFPGAEIDLTGLRR